MFSFSLNLEIQGTDISGTRNLTAISQSTWLGFQQICPSYTCMETLGDSFLKILVFELNWVLPWGSIFVIDRVYAPKIKTYELLHWFHLGDCNLFYFFNTCESFGIYNFLDLRKFQVLQTPMDLTPIIWK